MARRFGAPIKGGNYIGAVVSGKYALSKRFSVRPEVIIKFSNDNCDHSVAVLMPVTCDFNSIGRDRLRYFVGTDAGVTTGDETELQVVATTGADYLLDNRYALNGSVNYLPGLVQLARRISSRRPARLQHRA